MLFDVWRRAVGQGIAHVFQQPIGLSFPVRMIPRLQLLLKTLVGFFSRFGIEWITGGVLQQA